MTGNKIPRYLWFVLTLGASVAVIMLSIFYAQYRWLASEITSASVSEHSRQLDASFEQHARTQLLAIADRVGAAAGESETAVSVVLRSAVTDDQTITGMFYAAVEGRLQRVGSVPDVATDTGVAWLDDRLVMSSTVETGGARLGTLVASLGLWAWENGLTRAGLLDPASLVVLVALWIAVA